MILRRLKAHVEKENWFAVFIDFAIVVIGVFIGIQVANWNETRRDREDETAFLNRLHLDIMHVEDSSARLRERRIGLIDDLRSAAFIIFEGEEDATLNEAQCMALAVSRYYNINVLGLPSLVELTNAGRVGIIRNEALTTSLVTYQQTVAAFNDFVSREASLNNNLLTLTPELLRISPTFDASLGEMQTDPVCDVPGMRENQLFRNALSENIDSYDAYLRDGLLPWDAQLRKVHATIDQVLNVTHTEDTP